MDLLEKLEFAACHAVYGGDISDAIDEIKRLRSERYINLTEFRISEVPNMPDRIWIECKNNDRSGEGGEFSIEAFEKVVKEFYDKNF